MERWADIERTNYSLIRSDKDRKKLKFCRLTGIRNYLASLTITALARIRDDQEHSYSRIDSNRQLRKDSFRIPETMGYEMCPESFLIRKERELCRTDAFPLFFFPFGLRPSETRSET